MTAMVSSYVRDAWHTANDEGTTVLDASTGSRWGGCRAPGWTWPPWSSMRGGSGGLGCGS